MKIIGFEISIIFMFDIYKTHEHPCWNRQAVLWSLSLFIYLSISWTIPQIEHFSIAWFSYLLSFFLSAHLTGVFVGFFFVPGNYHFSVIIGCWFPVKSPSLLPLMLLHNSTGSLHNIFFLSWKSLHSVKLGGNLVIRIYFPESARRRGLGVTSQNLNLLMWS